MIPVSPLVILHVCGAVVGLLSGFMVIVLRKGTDLHRVIGKLFAVSMLVMSSSAVYLATFVKPVAINVVAGTLTLYLVSTAWVAARRREPKVGAFDVIALLVAAADGLGAWAYGLSAPKGSAIFFIFGTIALLFAASDVRICLRGGVAGTKRVARHLWRMCLALLLATLSFFPGQAKLLPPSWRESGLLWIPHLVLIAVTIVWIVRMRRKRKSGEELPEHGARPRRSSSPAAAHPPVRSYFAKIS